jgi:hypothetical protein
VDLLDVAQYANVSLKGNLADARISTAVDLGATVAITGFDKNTPVMLGVTGGWAPGMLMFDNSVRGQLRAGVLLGLYVPFLDFN